MPIVALNSHLRPARYANETTGCLRKDKSKHILKFAILSNLGALEIWETKAHIECLF